MSALWTPRLLLPRVVRKVVAPGKPGAYALGDDHRGFTVRYVGRSDTCLRTRLLTHNHLYGFEYCAFQCSATVEDAFAVECELYHVHLQLGIALKNQLHPASPRWTGASCRYCRFTFTW